MKKSFWSLIGILLIAPLVAIFGYRCYKDIVFTQNCGGYLKRAADANSVDLAKGELRKSLAYIEANNLTSGYTSILYNTPDEDVGFWYTNLSTSLKDLETMSPTASDLEKSNMLLKLRQSLLDHGDSGEHVTIPHGVSVFPHNAALAIGGILSLFTALIGTVMLLVVFNE